MFQLFYACVLFIGIISACFGAEDENQSKQKLKNFNVGKGRNKEEIKVFQEAIRGSKILKENQIQSNSNFKKNIGKNKKYSQISTTGQDTRKEVVSSQKDQPMCPDPSRGCSENKRYDKMARYDVPVSVTFPKSAARGFHSLVKRSKEVMMTKMTTTEVPMKKVTMKEVPVKKQCPKVERTRTRDTSAGQIKCQESHCGYMSYDCDLTCSDRLNSSMCEFHNCSGVFHCLKSKKKIKGSQVCDGGSQCPLADDEDTCSTTKRSFCLCLGFRMTVLNGIPSNGIFFVPDKPSLFNINSRVFPIESDQNVLILSEARYVSVNIFRNTIPISLFFRFPKLVHLNLSHSNIEYVQDGTFIGLSNLRHLDLSHNNIKRLSAYMFNGTPSLEILDLSYNHIRNLQDNVFNKLPGLIYLNLCHNRENEMFKISLRSSLPYGFRDSEYYNRGVLKLTSSVFSGLYRLTDLDLSSNDLADTPVHLFEKLSALRNLDLSNNLIGFWGLRNNMFFGLSNLRNINLSNNMITYFPDYLFYGLFNVIDLDLSYNILSDTAGRLFDRLTSFCDLDLPRISQSFLHDHMFSGLNKLRNLNLSHNLIHLEFDYNIFNGLESLQTLDISYNTIRIFPDHAFDGIACISNIYLSGNYVENISTEAFRNLSRLKELDFSHNRITFTADQKFNGSSSVRKLDLSHNKIVSISNHIFSEMTSLTVLYLSHNNIPALPGEAFDGLYNIKHLGISYNGLTNISIEAFSSLYKLNSLDLSHNHITAIPSFPIKAKIKKLDLSYNDLAYIQPRSFTNCHQMLSLNVIGNPLEVQEHMFDGLNRLQFLFTDTLFACCVKPASVGDNNCLAVVCYTFCEAAQADAISSCHTLIRSELLRIFLWIVGVCAVVGNAIVIIYRVVIDRDNITKSYSVFVLNLGISDFFMGIYLSVIGTVDAYYKGVYALNALEWKESLLCSFAGVLSTVSSEMSTFIVLLVTIDRLIVIIFPMSRHTGRSITWKLATILCVVLWIFSIILAIIPTFAAQSYFMGEFYSQSGVCLALPLTAHAQTGWEYSAAVFIGLNSIIFVVILVGQLAIFISLKRRRTVSSQSQRRDMEVAKTLFLVVATDFCCWCPIGVMGVMSMYGFRIPDTVYAWVMVFVLPVNAAVNPFLYTLASLWRRRRDIAASRATTLQLQSRTVAVTVGNT